MFKNSIENSIEKITSIVEYNFNDNILPHYPLILLTQSYNEEKNVTDFIKNVYNFVDGIIVLDDSSTDNTWDLLNSDKLLLKFKKNRISFNDLENRNLLLNVLENVFIKNNIIIDWFIWLDFDERIHNNDKYITILKKMLISTPLIINHFNLFMVHMWDEINYNGVYPHTKDGIQAHTRIIRNNKDKIINYIIPSNKNFHFMLTPYIDEKKYYFPLLVKHLGRNSSELRNEKYKLYTEYYDKKLENQNSYDHFIKKINTNDLLNYDSNAYNIIYTLLFHSLIPVIIYSSLYEPYIENICNNVIGSIKIDRETFLACNNISKNKHMVMILDDDNIYYSNIKNKLINNNINFVNNILASSAKILASSDKILNNNLFVGILNKNILGIVEGFKEENNIISPELTATIKRLLPSLLKDIFIKYNTDDLLLIDFLLLEDNIIIHNVNTNPSLYPDSIFVESAKLVGINYLTLINNIFKNAYQRNKKLFIC